MIDCIETTRCRDTAGYGRLRVKNKDRFHHRLAYIEANGLQWEDIDGLCVCHTCDNPPCVNPEHLFLGTHASNAADKVRKGRAARKLDWEKVREIRRRYKVGGVTQKGLADEYGVTSGMIRHVIRNRMWIEL